MSGVNKKPDRQKRREKEKPPEARARTLRRGRFTRIARDIGIPDDVILRALAPRGTSDARKTLNRWVRPYELGATPRDAKARQAAVYAHGKLEKASYRLRAARERAGIRTASKAGDNLDSQRLKAAQSPDEALGWVEAEIEFLEQYELAVRADQAANVLWTPRGGYPAADEAVIVKLRRRVARGCGYSRARSSVTETPNWIAPSRN